MEKLTAIGMRATRKTLGLPKPVEEGASAPVYIPGHGQAGESGAGTQEEPVGADWDSLVAALVSNKSYKTSVAMAYHPEPKEGWVKTPTGWVRVTEGEAGYTLNTGETVRL